MVALSIIGTLVNAITTLMATGGLAALVLLMTVESFGIPPLPSEIILPFAGFLVWTGNYSWPGAILAALAGGVIGSYIAYAIGRWGRHWLERPRGLLTLDPRHLATMDRWFRTHGEGTVLVARLLPVVRSYISYPAGTAKMEPVRFGIYTLVGATPFTVGLIYAGFLLRSRWSILQTYFHWADYAIIAALVVLVIVIALRWTGHLGAPRPVTPSSGSPPPAEGAMPSPTDPGSPPP